MDHVSRNAEYKAGSKSLFLQEASVAPALAKIHDVHSAAKDKKPPGETIRSVRAPRDLSFALALKMKS